MLSVDNLHSLTTAFSSGRSSSPILEPRFTPQLTSPPPVTRRAQDFTPPNSPTTNEFPDYNDLKMDGILPPECKRMNYQPPRAGRRHGQKNPAAYLGETEGSSSSSSSQQQENVVIVQPQAPAGQQQQQRSSGNVKYKTSSGERLFTLDEVKMIVAGALKEQDVKMRAEYEKLFYQKLHEQQLSMTRYIDEIRGANSSGSDCSYIS